MKTPIATKPANLSQSKGQNLSKTDQLLNDIRKTPLFRQLVPQEAGIGWPIPVRKDGKVYVILPFFGYSPSPEKGQSTTLFPPFATITLNWNNLMPVEYVDLQFRKPSEELNWEGQPIGTFPHPSVAQMTVGQYKEARRQLLAMYDELFEMLSQGSTFPDEWCDRFGKLLQTLLEPSLEQYYRALGPKFFDRFLATSR